MFSSFILGISWVALVGMCQAGNLQGSSPLSIVYTVYPYSETLLGVLKAEEIQPPRLSGNVVPPLGRDSQETRNSENDESAASSDSNDRDSSRNDYSNDETARIEQRTAAAEITYWPPIQRGAAPKPRLGRRPTDTQF